MNKEEYQWHRAAIIHDSFWLLTLSRTEQIAYFYLSTHCHKPWRISLTIMAQVLRCDTKRLKRAIDVLIARRMVKKTPGAGRAACFQVTLRTSQGWGQTPLPIGSDAPTHVGSNTPNTSGQTPPLTTTLEKGDEALLSLFTVSFRTWSFGHQPTGRHFHFTRTMTAKALECMRWLNGREGFGHRKGFEEFLDCAREYQSLPRDVLSPQKDLRALTPTKWLHDWPEQVRRVGIYQDEKREKVTRITSAEQ